MAAVGDSSKNTCDMFMHLRNLNCLFLIIYLTIYLYICLFVCLFTYACLHIETSVALFCYKAIKDLQTLGKSCAVQLTFFFFGWDNENHTGTPVRYPLHWPVRCRL